MGGQLQQPLNANRFLAQQGHQRMAARVPRRDRVNFDQLVLGALTQQR